MRIQCIRTYLLEHLLQEPFGFSQWAYADRHALLVEIVTADGLSGWGECYGPAAVNQAAVGRFYAPRILGHEALETDRLWHHLWQSSLDFARGGVIMGAMSGIDMALWDLKGKALQQPLHQLLGGKYRDEIPCYATGMYFRDRPEEELINDLVAEACGYRDQGFRP